MRNAEGFGEGAGVQTSGAAESYEREVARVATALDGDDSDGFFHGGIDHAEDAGGEFGEREPAFVLLQKFFRQAAGAVEVEGEISTEKARELQAAQEEIRVGDGGLRPTAVADGSGIGAGGLGADAQDAGGVEAGERASTGSDGVNVEHGNANGQARDLRVGRGVDRAFDERDVRGGAAHVEGDDAIESASAGGRGGADYTSGRAGEDCANGLAGGDGKGGDASAGLHDENAGGESPGLLSAAFRGAEAPLFHQFPRAAFKVFQITRHDWLEIGVDYYG